MRAYFGGTICDSLRRSIAISDQSFDRIYPLPTQMKSRVHWTPVAVAMRAASLLAPLPGMRVLDIGSGAGKLCCVAAFVTDALWYGIEREPELVDTAIASAELLGISDRVQFCAADMTAVDWADFDSLYLFNPFEASLFDGATEIERAWEQFDRQVTSVEQRLAVMPRGTRVVTFHGFGGEMPACYRRVTTESIASGELALWINDPDGAARRMQALA